MFSTDFIFRQQENLVDNQKCQAGFRPLCNKIPLLGPFKKYTVVVETKHFQHNGVKTDIELNLNFEFYLYFLKYFHSIIDCKITEL